MYESAQTAVKNISDRQLEQQDSLGFLEGGLTGPGVGRAGPPEAPSWECRRPSPPRVLTGSFLCVCLCPDLPFL